MSPKISTANRFSPLSFLNDDDDDDSDRTQSSHGLSSPESSRRESAEAVIVSYRDESTITYLINGVATCITTTGIVSSDDDDGGSFVSNARSFLTEADEAGSYQEFMRVLLTIDPRRHLLVPTYREADITAHMRHESYVPPDYLNSSARLLPLVYESLDHYKRAHLPLLLLNTWAKMHRNHSVALDRDQQKKKDKRLTKENEKKKESEKDEADPDNDEDDNFNKGHQDPRRNRRYPLWVVKVDEDKHFSYLRLRARMHKLDADEQLFRLQKWAVTLEADDDQQETKADEHNVPLHLAYVGSYRTKLKRAERAEVDHNHKNLPFWEAPQPIVSPSEPNPIIQIEYLVLLAASDFVVPGSRRLTLRPLEYLAPTKRQIEILDKMARMPHFEHLCLTPEAGLFTLDTREPVGFNFYGKRSFNAEQREAIVACYNALRKPNQSKIALIRGPPGTGKSRAIVGMIKNLFVNCPSPRHAPLRLLICAPSNGAIDELARRLIKEGDFCHAYNVRLIRLGLDERVHPDVKPYTVNAIARLAELAEFGQINSGKSRISRKFRENALVGANVYLSTLNSCQDPLMVGLFGAGAKCQSIRAVIVDEASQCTEPELLMPLLYSLRTPDSRLILIGDHQQLPATVMSNYAADARYGRSMFERFFRHFEESHEDDEEQQQREPSPVHALVRQYRMHPEISRFPSEHFYGGALVDAPTPNGTRKHRRRFPLMPYTVFDLANSKEMTTDDGSTSNPPEAKFVLNLTLAILAQLGLPKSRKSGRLRLPPKLPVTLGVITFYAGQRPELYNRFAAYHPNLPRLVDINTVDAFQGQERDVMIVSCVRTRTPGFIRKTQRMNVALTRAKSALFVCLNVAAFRDDHRDEHWMDLIRDADDRGRLLPMSCDCSREDIVAPISP